jgi:hypothetical protein
MPKNDFIIPVIVVLGIVLLIFVCYFIYNKYKKVKRERKKKITLEMLKEKLVFEIKGKAKFFFEKNTKISNFMIHVVATNKCTDVVVIRNMEVIMGDFIGKLEKEKATKIVYHSQNSKGINVGEKITFPFGLAPNTTNDMSLTFKFDTISVVVRKFSIKIYTLYGELVFPVTVEIDR